MGKETQGQERCARAEAGLVGLWVACGRTTGAWGDAEKCLQHTPPCSVTNLCRGVTCSMPPILNNRHPVTPCHTPSHPVHFCDVTPLKGYPHQEYPHLLHPTPPSLCSTATPPRPCSTATPSQCLPPTTHLGQVIEGAGLLGVGQGVGAAVVGDGDVALLNVNVGGAILAHGAQLDQVAVWLEVLGRREG